MSLIVEDGTVVAGAESYLSVADANTYWTNHGSPSAWTAASTAAKESALRYATQWVDERFWWGGVIHSTAQVLDWPRQSCYDDEGRLIDDASIPWQVKQAVAEMAKAHIDAALNASLTRGGAVQSERVDVIEVTYMDWASPETDFPYVKRLLQPLTVTGTGSILPVTRVA